MTDLVVTNLQHPEATDCTQVPQKLCHKLPLTYRNAKLLITDVI